MSANSKDSYSEAEAARRRDAIVRNMIATPPKPHEPLGKKKAGQSKSAPKKPRKKA